MYKHFQLLEMVQQLKTKLEQVEPELHEATANIFELNQKMMRENQQLNMKIAVLQSQQDLQMSEFFPH